MSDIALKLFELAEKKIRADSLLHPEETVSVLAVACAISIAKFNEMDPAKGTELAATALRTIIKNLMTKGVRVPDDLGMRGWTPPNIHQNTSTH
jgi:hypothetical protein